MIQRDNLFFRTLDEFLAKKISANRQNTAYRTGSFNAEVQDGEPDVMWQSVVYIESPKAQWTHGVFYDFTGGTMTEIDSELDLFSENPIQNRAVTQEINNVYFTLEELKADKVSRSELATVNNTSLIGTVNVDTTPATMTDADVTEIFKKALAE